MSGWLERYERGQHRRVWTEMTSLGSDLRNDETALAEAQAVCKRQCVGRARTLSSSSNGYRPMAFQFESDPLVNPSRDATTQLDALEVEVGVLPLALRAWLEEVGQVNLNGAHPEWTFDYPDPLVVDAPLECVRSEYERWSADRGTEWEDGFEIPLAPDYLHKGQRQRRDALWDRGARSGGALLLWQAHQTTFGNYLRIASAMEGRRDGSVSRLS